ncbi:uncharacterized protein LOC111599272 [Drosophila hydei]|uniref:Uncharacterized protein LOC111599272 n=1 Tax=Drosophila hydei TaxID=7224 RepID=A0A6J1LUB1_DROHY|nr:uncharacterized protein LOC111599272 [Drosophila hydei]
MRFKEYPEIVVDVIPKLYEDHIKVFITHLYGMEEKVDRLPKQFCKMYTTQPLANQLLGYLSSRGAKISLQDFHIVKEAEPFQLRLSDGKRLELMLCAGNELGNSLMLLIRKLQGGRLLYYYSAVQQDDLCRLMGNVTYQEWIAQGVDELYLNLKAADQPFKHVDFEEVARIISDCAASAGGTYVLKLPLFGYEYLLTRLARTLTLYGHIKLMSSYLHSYCCLGADLGHFEQDGYAVTVQIEASNSWPLPLNELLWSPMPNRMNLMQLCSLLRPVYINGIVDFHATGNVPAVPQYLKRFRTRYSPKASAAPAADHSNVPETQLIQWPSAENIAETQTQQENTAARKDSHKIIKQRKLQFVDFDEDDD